MIPRKATDDVKWAADALARALVETAGRKMPVRARNAARELKGDFVLCAGSTDADLGSEGYRLRVGAGMVLEARDGRGLYCGVQTLRQMVRKDRGGTIARADIRDWPSWKYRGVMLDPARNYMTVNFPKRQIDVLSSTS